MKPTANRILAVSLFLAAAMSLQALPIEVDGIEEAMLPDRILSEAFAAIGTPYEVGATGPSGFDCSGLVYRICMDLTGKALPRTVDALMAAGREVAGDLLPADLVFFDTTGGPSHVGIYIGGGKFVHAASEGRYTGVIVSALGENYYKARFLGARRFLEWTIPVIRIPIDGTAAVETVPGSLPAGFTFSYQVASRLPEDSFVTIRFFRGAEEWLSRTVKAPAGGLGGLSSLTTQPGEWTAVLSTTAGRELYRLSFFVAE